MKKVSFFILGACLMFNACTIQQDDAKLNHTKTLNDNWSIQSSAIITGGGEDISKTSFVDNDWYSVDIPSTVLNALVKNGVYSDIFKGTNYDKIPTEQFHVPWWYRKVFTVEDEFENARLILHGINYKVNVWLNGELIADSIETESAFKISEINVTEYLTDGENVLAIEVIPPQKGDLTIGFVDWNPKPKDSNMGLWRGVSLRFSDAVSLSNVFVRTNLNTQTLDEAEIIISAELINHSNIPAKVVLQGELGEIKFTKHYELKPKQTKIVVISPEDVEELLIQNPKLWWPNNMGNQVLHDLALNLVVNNRISDRQEVRFGIRDIDEYWTEKGHKGWKVNGKKILIRGGGWVDDIMLADTDEKVRAQVEYAKHMNLNALRLEGFWGNNSTLFDAADENGILLMIGWSCHWEWPEHCGRDDSDDKYMMIRTPKDKEMHSEAYMDQVKWLRNHPSIFLWAYGSDLLLEPDLERTMKDKLDVLDPTRPILAGCRDVGLGLPFQYSEVSGPTGVKMRGPYGYVTPNFWYIDTVNGGAFGFNTETGPGAVIPTIESMKKMIPEDDLWPINKVWDYHSSLYAFSGHDLISSAIYNRYGKADNVDDFVYLAQVSNYEALRAMFEAFGTNKFDATGVIQWMYNSAWPSTYWQLFDWYLMPTGAFYGTQKACAPLHLSYNYKDKNIYLLNETLNNYSGLKGRITVLNQKSKIVFEEEFEAAIIENTSEKVFNLPKLNKLSTTYFIKLDLLNDSGELIDDNFYWLSTKEDVLDFEEYDGFFGPVKSYCDLSGIRELPETKITAIESRKEVNCSIEYKVELENNSNVIAFFIELSLKDKESNETILPVFWNDNYISLIPGEKKTVTARLGKTVVGNKEVVFSYKGLNVE